MNVNEEFVKVYAKKIMGFSYQKTCNVFDAEDLASEIMIQLVTTLKKRDFIADMDGFVYTVCYYTWSKKLRKEKNTWLNCSLEEAMEITGDYSTESTAEFNILSERLKYEIAYLSRLHREIIIMFYYENKTGNEIAEKFNITPSTVRWHIREIKKKLREGFEMTEQNEYIPRRIMAGLNGNTSKEYGQAGLGEDRLADNICLACYGNKLSIEEIARTLKVAAAYIENHINRLVFMDYLKIVDKNKYTTNFFIEQFRHNVLHGKYHYHNAEPYAVKIYDAMNKKFDRIQDIGFLGSGLDKDFLLWALIPLLVNRLYYMATNTIVNKVNIDVNNPLRKDGSRHWVCATLCDDSFYENQTEFTREEIDFHHKSRGNGIKTNESHGYWSFMLDSKATRDIGIHWREFGDSEINELVRISEIINRQEIPNSHDKLLIAHQVNLGNVTVNDGIPEMLIPILDNGQYKKLMGIYEEIYDELGRDFLVSYIENFAALYEKEIPGFISKEEKLFNCLNIHPEYAIIYRLADIGKVRYPSDDEARRICTVLFQP